MHFFGEIVGIGLLGRLVAMIQGYAPTAKSERSTSPIEAMSRIHSLELGINCSDSAIDEELQDVTVYR